MTPKEKAELIYISFDGCFKAPFKSHEQIKQCAFIAVDQIISSFEELTKGLIDSDFPDLFESLIYWQSVKEELLKM